MIGSLTQGHLLPMVTPAALLRRVGRIDCDELSASFFRFARQSVKELRPGRVTDAFRKTMIVNQPVHLQVLHTDHPETVHDLSGLLMSEVVSSETNPFMDSRYDFAMLPAFRCAFCQFGVLPLNLRQRFLFISEKARIGDLFTGREGRKGCESDINPDWGSKRGQAFRLTLDAERDVPFARRSPVDGTGFDTSLDGPMVDHLDTANFGERDAGIMRQGKAGLREGEAIVAVMPTEARVSRSFASLDTPEKGLHGQINAHGDVLQDLRMHGAERGTLRFQEREGVDLSVAGPTLTSLFVGRLAGF